MKRQKLNHNKLFLQLKIIFLIVILFCCQTTFGQNRTETYKGYKCVDKDGGAPDFINIIATTSFDNTTYYTNEKNKPLDGCYQIMTQSNKYFKINLSKGVPNGPWSSYIDGYESKRGNYKNGKPDGKEYDNIGTKRIITYKEGVIQHLEEYSSDNKKLREINYVNGKISGNVKSYSENGNLIEEKNFLDGKLNGKQVYNYMSGAQKIETYKEDILCGEYLELYANGQIKVKGSYDESGKKNGQWTWYTETGQLEEESNYLNGKLNGTKRTYQNGKLNMIAEYKNGSKGGNYQKYWNGTTLIKEEGTETKEGYFLSKFYTNKGNISVEELDLRNGLIDKTEFDEASGVIRSQTLYSDGSAIRRKVYDLKGKLKAVQLVDERGTLVTVQEFNTTTGKVIKKNTQYKKPTKYKIVEDASGIIDIQ